jgi:hypothetical protein
MASTLTPATGLVVLVTVAAVGDMVHRVMTRQVVGDLEDGAVNTITDASLMDPPPMPLAAHEGAPFLLLMHGGLDKPPFLTNPRRGEGREAQEG